MPVLLPTIYLFSPWRIACFGEATAFRASQHLSVNNRLKQSLSLLCITAVLPLLWQLPAQGESSAHRASENEQRRIVIESSSHYQFTDATSGVEYRGESQAVRIRRRSQPLTRQPQAYTEESTVAGNVNTHPRLTAEELAE